MPRYCVYCAVFGGYDLVSSVKFTDTRHETPFFLYSDEPQRAKGWTHIRADNPVEGSAELSNRLLKTSPPEKIRNFPFACYVDGNVKVRQPLDDFFVEFLNSGADVGFFRHSDRQNLRQEFEACHRQGKVDESRGGAQIESYEKEGFGSQVPLLEGSFFFRRNNRRTTEMMALWSDELLRWKTRDQLSLPYAIWKTGLKVHLFEGSPRRMYHRFIYTPHAGKGLGAKIGRTLTLLIINSPLLAQFLANAWGLLIRNRRDAHR